MSSLPPEAQDLFEALDDGQPLRNLDAISRETVQLGERLRVVRRVDADMTWNENGRMNWTLGEVGEVLSFWDPPAGQRDSHPDCIKLQFKAPGGRTQVWTYDVACLERA